MFVFGPAVEALTRLRESAPGLKSSSGSNLSLSSIISVSRPRTTENCKLNTPPTSQRIENYEVTHQIGSGRWAQVFHATHKFTQVSVALKRVLKRDDGVIQRFMLREKEAIKRVGGHPNVVKIYEVFEDAEYIYLVQEYIPNGSLRQRLQRDRCLTEKESAKCIMELALALTHCHSRGVVHRDLSLNNIMFDANDCAVVVDFGLAAICKDKDIDHSTFSEACGSAFYTPPEVHAAKFGNRYHGPPVDAYALGVLLHVCLTGHLPYNGSVSQCKAGVGYKPPSKCSPEAQDLLIGLTEPDVCKRITLQQVLSHPFFATHLPEEIRQQRPLVEDDSERDRIMEMMEHMDLKREDVLLALENNVFNHTAALYYMLKVATCQQRMDMILRSAGLSATTAIKESGHELTLRQILLKPLVTST